MSYQVKIDNWTINITLENFSEETKDEFNRLVAEELIKAAEEKAA